MPTARKAVAEGDDKKQRRIMRSINELWSVRSKAKMSILVPDPLYIT